MLRDTPRHQCTYILLTFFSLLISSPRPIPTRPGLMRPTSVPQRCWAVAKLSPDPLSPRCPAVRAPCHQAPTCFHHGIDLLGLHTCTYHLPRPAPHCKRRSVSSVELFSKMIVLVKRWIYLYSVYHSFQRLYIVTQWLFSSPVKFLFSLSKNI